jgi:GTP:adenosylcobinamide-phosphate guanylyltransferase
MSVQPRKFAAVVLAGDRGPDDPVAAAAGVCGKALVPVGGRPMVLRVWSAVRRPAFSSGSRNWPQWLPPAR